MAIEIIENTLIKLLVRRGADVDRKNVILTEGELGYSTDSKRLFVGDNQTYGGNVVGNLFKGSVINLTTLANIVSGDLAFDTDNKLLYRFKGGANVLANWEQIGGVYEGDGSTIDVAGNVISLNPSFPLGNSLVRDSSGNIALNPAGINTNAIAVYNSNSLSMPSNLTINGVNYNWPSYAPTGTPYLYRETDGSLKWGDIQSTASLFLPGTAGQIPVGTIMPYVSSSSAPAGWLLCNGQSVTISNYPLLYSVIGTTFGGSGGNFNVPNLINKTIYGVSSNPAGSTTYSLCASTTSIGTLSSVGMLYIIKAEADQIVTSSLTVKEPLSVTVNNNTKTNTTFSNLSGNITLTLAQVISSQQVESTSTFRVDSYGRVIEVTPAGGSLGYIEAGNITQIGPANNDAINQSSPIVFFKTPVTIYSVVGSVDNYHSFRESVTAYPYITTITSPNGGSPRGVRTTPNASIPIDAKNIILDVLTKKHAGYQPAGMNYTHILAAPSLELLNAIDSTSIGVNEYVVNTSTAFGAYDHTATSNQVFIPLSASPTDQLVFALRMTYGNLADVTIRAIGYTT